MAPSSPMKHERARSCAVTISSLAHCTAIDDSRMSKLLTAANQGAMTPRLLIVICPCQVLCRIYGLGSQPHCGSNPGFRLRMCRQGLEFRSCPPCPSAHPRRCNVQWLAY
eukprot:scaffold128653_cov32-Tisochrysis_lutea.AAC.2